MDSGPLLARLKGSFHMNNKGRTEVVIVWLAVAFFVLIWVLAVYFSCIKAQEPLTQKEYDQYLDTKYGKGYAEKLYQDINEKVLGEMTK